MGSYWNWQNKFVIGKFCLNAFDDHSWQFENICLMFYCVHLLQSLELWNMIENKTMTLSAHDGLIAALAVSTATGLVASASHDKIVKLWKWCDPSNLSCNTSYFKSVSIKMLVVVPDLVGWSCFVLSSRWQLLVTLGTNLCLLYCCYFLCTVDKRYGLPVCNVMFSLRGITCSFSFSIWLLACWYISSLSSLVLIFYSTGSSVSQLELVILSMQITRVQSEFADRLNLFLCSKNFDMQSHHLCCSRLVYFEGSPTCCSLISTHR